MKNYDVSMQHTEFKGRLGWAVKQKRFKIFSTQIRSPRNFHASRLPIVEINVEVNASSLNLKRMQVLPTPESLNTQ